MSRLECFYRALRLGSILAFVALAMLLVANVNVGRLRALPAQDAVVRCDPEVVVVEIGETASFTIFVESVVDLYAGDVQMSFDPSIAQVVDADPNRGGTQIEILDEFLSPDFVVRDRADNVAGTIWYANTQINPAEPVSGSGSLARVTMESLKPGAFDVVITSHELNVITGNEIPSSARDCRVAFFDPNAISQTFLPIGIAP